jgi:hypothetical protein
VLFEEGQARVRYDQYAVSVARRVELRHAGGDRREIVVTPLA